VGVTTIGEIGVMRGIDRPGDNSIIDEDRLSQHDIRQVRPAPRIGVIAN
jgi:hypothetical protein